MHTGLVHGTKKSYMCSICDYFCSQKCDLKTHAESVHDKYMVQKFSICHFDCSQKGNLKVHIWSVHEIKKHISAQYVIIFVLKNVV